MSGRLCWGVLLALVFSGQAGRADCLPSQYDMPHPAGLSLRSEPAQIAIGVPFRLIVSNCMKDGAQVIRVDARMPDHGHGMNYKAVLNHATKTQTIAQNLMFHMPGLWQISVELERSGARSIWTSDVSVFE